jgi:hypothetical protein
MFFLSWVQEKNEVVIKKGRNNDKRDGSLEKALE